MAHRAGARPRDARRIAARLAAAAALLGAEGAAAQPNPGFYVTFSGESSTPIANVYALDAAGRCASPGVLARRGEWPPLHHEPREHQRLHL